MGLYFRYVQYNLPCAIFFIFSWNCNKKNTLFTPTTLPNKLSITPCHWKFHYFSQPPLRNLLPDHFGVTPCHTHRALLICSHTFSLWLVLINWPSIESNNLHCSLLLAYNWIAFISLQTGNYACSLLLAYNWIAFISLQTGRFTCLLLLAYKLIAFIVQLACCFVRAKHSAVAELLWFLTVDSACSKDSSNWLS